MPPLSSCSDFPLVFCLCEPLTQKNNNKSHFLLFPQGEGQRGGVNKEGPGCHCGPTECACAGNRGLQINRCERNRGKVDLKPVRLQLHAALVRLLLRAVAAPRLKTLADAFAKRKLTPPCRKAMTPVTSRPGKLVVQMTGFKNAAVSKHTEPLQQQHPGHLLGRLLVGRDGKGGCSFPQREEATFRGRSEGAGSVNTVGLTMLA